MGHDLSEQQISELKEAFSVFDKDDSGSISKDELENVMKSIGISPSKKSLNEMFKMIDTDRSGTINFSEFLSLMSGSSHEKEPEDDLKKVFEVFDKDNNGFITSGELKQALESLNENVSDQDVEDMIKEADLNKDGRVNYEEFVRMMRQK